MLPQCIGTYEIVAKDNENKSDVLKTVTEEETQLITADTILRVHSCIEKILPRIMSILRFSWTNEAEILVWYQKPSDLILLWCIR